jgi:hypothetical protein
MTMVSAPKDNTNPRIGVIGDWRSILRNPYISR